MNELLKYASLLLLAGCSGNIKSINLENNTIYPPNTNYKISTITSREPNNNGQRVIGSIITIEPDPAEALFTTR